MTPVKRRVLAILRSDGSLVLTQTGLEPSEWNQLSLLVADRLLHDSDELTVRVDDLIARTRALGEALGRLGCEFEPDEEVAHLLRTRQQDTSALHELLVGKTSVREMMANGPIEICRDLRDFQLRDLDLLWNMRHGANFSVPGAGKTTVTYALHACERNSGRVDKLLVVAPLSAYGSWVDEVAVTLKPSLTVGRWEAQALRGSDDVSLINYQRVVSESDAIRRWMLKHKVHLVVDEAHRAKRGSTGEWGRAILGFASLARRRDILTGTPAPNHPADLAALLDIAWFPGASRRVLPPKALVKDPGPTALSAASRSVRPLFTRTTKDDLELPPITLVSHSCEMRPLQKNIYEALRGHFNSAYSFTVTDESEFARIGAIATYLIQAAVSPQLLSEAASAETYSINQQEIKNNKRLWNLIDAYSSNEVPTKIEMAARIVWENSQCSPPRKTLVWSNYVSNLLALREQFPALKPALVYGGIPSAQDAPPGVVTREREIERFKDPDSGCLVLLANPAAMSEGVSLHHTCHEAVYVDRTFNAGQYLQSLDRIHRLGLPPSTVTRIHLLVAEHTIDESVRRRVETKMRVMGQILDDSGVTQLALPSDGEDESIVDDKQDILEILAHLGRE